MNPLMKKFLALTAAVFISAPALAGPPIGGPVKVTLLAVDDERAARAIEIAGFGDRCVIRTKPVEAGFNTLIYDLQAIKYFGYGWKEPMVATLTIKRTGANAAGRFDPRQDALQIGYKYLYCDVEPPLQPVLFKR